METRLSNTPSTLPLSPSRPESAPVRAAIQTDLAPPLAVSAQVGAEKSRWSRKDDPSSQRPREKISETSIETDRETGDLVYKVIDPESRAVLSQYPYESLLKLRAYIRAASDKD
jgi:hypothetical protein